MTNHNLSNFKVGNRIFFKNEQPGKWDLKWRAGYRNVYIECNGHYLHIENQAAGKTRPCSVKDVVHEPPVELWNVDTMFGRAQKFIYHPTNLPTIPLNTYYLQKEKNKLITYKSTHFLSTLHRDPSGERYTMSWVGIIPFSSEGLPYTQIMDHQSLDRQLCMFSWQRTLAHQLLVKSKDQLLASQLVVNALLDEFANTDNIYESYKPAIKSAMQLLETDSENLWSKRNLLPFLGDVLKCLTGTATTSNTWEN